MTPATDVTRASRHVPACARGGQPRSRRVGACPRLCACQTCPWSGTGPPSSTASRGRCRTTSAGSCSVRTAPARPPCCRSRARRASRPPARSRSWATELGGADLFELRPRIGFASTALARRIPVTEKVIDVVLTAAYSVTGRWNEEYEELDVRARSACSTSGARRFTDRTFGELSDGEQKRVQIARAVMTDPEILFLDEPAASLDLGARESLVRTTRRVRAELRLAGHRHGDAPRRGDPRGLHARADPGGRARPGRRGDRRGPDGRHAERRRSGSN